MVGADAAQLRLFLFGRMRLETGGVSLSGVSDQLYKVLALIALNGDCINRDTLVERLWPDSRVNSGRHQLRNLLSRLRSVTGAEIDRQGELVVLRDPLWCDVQEYLRVVPHVLAGAGPGARYSRALAAHDLWKGAPLEAWCFEEWAVGVRERAFALHDRLWRLLSEGPGCAGDDMAMASGWHREGASSLASS